MRELSKSEIFLEIVQFFSLLLSHMAELASLIQILSKLNQFKILSVFHNEDKFPATRAETQSFQALLHVFVQEY